MNMARMNLVNTHSYAYDSSIEHRAINKLFND